jgi:hypothetical protein
MISEKIVWHQHHIDKAPDLFKSVRNRPFYGSQVSVLKVNRPLLIQ